MSPEDAAIDLVIEDGSRVGVAYSLMSEDNVRRQTALPWMSFGSDAEAMAPEGVFLLSNPHPRAYGNFARLLARYVRDEHALTLEDAVHRLSGLPAQNLSLTDRGLLKKGYYADVVVFDPEDHPGPCDVRETAPVFDGRLGSAGEWPARAQVRRAHGREARAIRARPRLDRTRGRRLPGVEPRLELVIPQPATSGRG